MPSKNFLIQRLGLAGASNVLATLGALILIPVLTKNLTITDFGSWAIFMATIGLMPTIAMLGLGNSMMRFLPSLTDARAIQEAFYSLLSCVVIVSLVISGLFMTFARQIAISTFNNELGVALFLPISIFIACLNAFLLIYFRTFQQITKYSALILLQTYSQVAFISYFVLTSHTLQGAVIGLLIAQLVLLSIIVFLILRQIGIVLPRFTNMREYIHLGLPLLPASLSGWITNSSDVYIIGLLLGTAAVGYYSPAYSLGRSITMLSQPFIIIFPALLAKYYDTGEVHSVRTIMQYSWKYYFGIAIPSVCALSVLSKPILTIISTPDIAAHSYLVVPFIAAGALFLGAYEVVIIAITLKKKTPVTALIWMVAAALNVGLNLILIPYLGILGAAITTLVAYIVAFTFTASYSFRHFKFDIGTAFIIKCVGTSAAISLLLFFWNPAGLASIILSVGVSAAIYLSILLALRGFTTEEINFFLRILKGSQ